MIVFDTPNIKCPWTGHRVLETRRSHETARIDNILSISPCARLGRDGALNCRLPVLVGTPAKDAIAPVDGTRVQLATRHLVPVAFLLPIALAPAAACNVRAADLAILLTPPAHTGLKGDIALPRVVGAPALDRTVRMDTTCVEPASRYPQP